MYNLWRWIGWSCLEILPVCSISMDMSIVLWKSKSQCPFSRFLIEYKTLHLFLIMCSLPWPSKLKMRTVCGNFKCFPVQWNPVFLFHVLCCYLVSLFWTIFWLGSECQLTFHLVQQNSCSNIITPIVHSPRVLEVVLLTFWPCLREWKNPPGLFQASGCKVCC